jgi:SNF family Na+-dependent transporter
MKQPKMDPLTQERIRMENLGRVFIILFFLALIFAGHFFLNL